jgi:hypothetical protein
MTGQNAGQPTLFDITQLAGRAQAPCKGPEMPARSLGPEIRGPFAGESREVETGPFWSVSPFRNQPLNEVCAFCSAEVRAPGFVMLDFEELGVFCNEECGDKRFRLYLNDTADEESELDCVV